MYDFSGYATKNDIRCSDGRIIRKNAFEVNDGQKVPLVWNHCHQTVSEVLGHALLTNKKDGVWADCSFNNTINGQNAKEAVKHGDVTSLSIWANNLQQIGSDVIHGNIREVSLVLAGANPGAFIESVMVHGEPMDDGDDEGIFYSGSGLILSHADEEEKNPEKQGEDEEEKTDETVTDVLDTLSDKQKQAVGVLVAEILSEENRDETENESEEDIEKKEEEEMKHNIFADGDKKPEQVISHSDRMKILEDAQRCGSLRAAIRQNIQDGVLSHSVDTTGMTVATGTQQYGFNDPDMLFPDFKTLNNQPEWISRNMDWVQKVMNAVHKTPFSRIKSVYADITEDDARARGYMKGNMKKEEFFTTMKRTTSPGTVYKKQKMDHDDVKDITDFDVVAWIKAEMRIMLEEEIARAILIGDGRATDSDDHIKEDNIRPIAKDVALFNTIEQVRVGASDDEQTIAKKTINTAIRSRKHYKGSGNPTFFTTEDILTEMLLIEDGIGHKLYKTEEELRTALRVKEIITVEPMVNQKVNEMDLIGIIVNLADYNVGTDKGSEIESFEAFDIDYNQHKYLLETRMSGALIKPYSAITLVKATAAG